MKTDGGEQLVIGCIRIHSICVMVEKILNLLHRDQRVDVLPRVDRGLDQDVVGALGIAKDGFRDLSPVQRRPAASDCEQIRVGSGHLREVCHHLLICIEGGLRAHKVDAGRILGRRSR